MGIKPGTKLIGHTRDIGTRPNMWYRLVGHTMQGVQAWEGRQGRGHAGRAHWAGRPAREWHAGQ